jgi:hypothetical protein
MDFQHITFTLVHHGLLYSVLYKAVTQVQCINAVIKPLSYCSTLSYSSLLSEPICTTLIRILCGFSLALLSKCMLGRLGLVEA